jgi:hypothetical protein
MKRIPQNLRLAIAACLFFAAAFVHAQNATSVAIAGTVTDPDNKVVVGAKVTATNLATGLTQTASTSDSGFYAEESLPPGDYSVTVNATGFRTTTITNIHLDPGERRGVNVGLTVGSETVSLLITADAGSVQTESAEAGGTITSQEVQSIPLNGRNFQMLLTVVPGVSSVNGANNFYQTGQGAISSEVVVNGSSDEETMYTIDGVYNDTSSSDITLPITPVIDHIEEMRVLGDNYSARYGLAGRQVLVTTKNGGEKYHGSGYGFSRSNEYGSAHSFLQNGSVPLTSLHLTDWGITLGGPVKIPKVFNSDGNRKVYFFVGADWKAEHQSYVSGARNVFTVANRTGDLSSEPASPTGAVLTPYASLPAAYKAVLDARTGGAAGSGAACITQKNGTGNYNQILPACMDPNTVALMTAYWPTPNYNLTLTTTNQNYLNDNPTKFSVNDELYRGDYNLNNNNSITLRVLHEETAGINATRGYNDYAPNPNSATYTPAMNALLRWQWTIKPTLFNTVGLGEIYTKYYSQLIGKYTLPSGVAINQKFPGVDPLNRIPDISMNNDSHSSENWFWLGEGALPTHSNSATTELSDDLTWVKGNHVFQGGFTFMWNLLHADSASAFPMGNFCFDGSYSGDTAGDFLLGFLASGSHACSGYGYEQTNLQRDGDFRNNWAEAYFQDDWKVNPKLTLNLGIRWSYYSAPAMDGNNIANFVPSAFASANAPAVCAAPNGAALGSLPACGVSSYGFQNTSWQYLNGTNQPLEKDGVTAANVLTNGMATAGTSVPAGFTVPRKGLFAPRIGFAYRLTNDGKTSIHGGVGFGYTQVSLLQTSNLLSNIPFVQTPVYFNTEFTNPSVPAGQTAAGAIANPPGLLGVSATSPGYRPATIRNYSLTIEREVVPGGVVSIGYAGMTTQHIFTNQWDQNFPLNANPVTGQYANPAGTAACAAAGAAAGVVGQPTSGFSFDPCINAGQVNSYYYRPYQGYSTMTTGASFGVANYNGLLVGYVQKMHNLTSHVSYTFSKALGDINASGVQVAYSSSGSFQNPNNPLGEYGRPDYDRPGVFVYSLVYDLPFFNKTSNYLAHTLLGGWNVTSYMVAESGFAQTPTFSSGLATRPNAGTLVRNHGTSGKPGQQPLYSYQDFSRPAYGFFGNASVGSLRAPKEVSIHASTEKAFAFGDRFSAKIGAQAFNVFNHPNVMGISSGWSPTSQGTFGMASSYGDPRLMQFYVKLIF